MIPKRGEHFTRAVDDLNQVADGLVRVAKECREIALGIESEQAELEALKGKAAVANAKREAAALLHVSPWTVYKWVGDPGRRLPVKRAGSRVFFVRSELLDWAEGVR